MGLGSHWPNREPNGQFDVDAMTRALGLTPQQGRNAYQDAFEPSARRQSGNFPVGPSNPPPRRSPRLSGFRNAEEPRLPVVPANAPSGRAGSDFTPSQILAFADYRKQGGDQDPQHFLAFWRRNRGEYGNSKPSWKVAQRLCKSMK